MSATFSITTLGDAINAVLTNTSMLGMSDRNWTIRDNIALAYEFYHTKYGFYETIESEVAATWVSGAKKFAIATTIADWRSKPLIITSSDETLPWVRQTAADVMLRRSNYEAGDGMAMYLEDRFIYATQGSDLITVTTKGAVTLAVTHFAQPTPITATELPTFTLVFPSEFTPILVYKAVVTELGCAIDTVARYKESRQEILQKIQKFEEMIAKMEKEIELSLSPSQADKHVLQAGPYAMMFYDANRGRYTNLESDWGRH